MWDNAIIIPQLTIKQKANNMQTELENLQRQIRLSDVIDVLMAQSLQLMEIVNKNQKEVNRLKKEQQKLESKLGEITI
jgi:hypothetical protein